MALTAAGSGHSQYAMVAGIICAATALFGVTVLGTTIHRDNNEHHAVPSLLNDSYEKAPPFARLRGAPKYIEVHRAG